MPVVCLVHAVDSSHQLTHVPPPPPHPPTSPFLTPLPSFPVRSQLEGHPQLGSLLEVVMDLGRPPLARFPRGDARLGEGVITGADLEYAVGQVRRRRAAASQQGVGVEVGPWVQGAAGALGERCSSACKGLRALLVTGVTVYTGSTYMLMPGMDVTVSN
jgi:hypothetical protein